MTDEKKLSHNETSDLTIDQRWHLILGTTVRDTARTSLSETSDISDFPFESEEHRRRVWEEYKDTLMAEIWDKSFYDNGFYYFENQFIGETPFPDAFHEYEKGFPRGKRRFFTP